MGNSLPRETDKKRVVIVSVLSVLSKVLLHLSAAVVVRSNFNKIALSLIKHKRNRTSFEHNLRAIILVDKINIFHKTLVFRITNKYVLCTIGLAKG